jgi:hypothetical protein
LLARRLDGVNLRLAGLQHGIPRRWCR